MNSTDSVIQFLALLSDVNVQFNDAAVYAVRCIGLSSVSTSVIPIRSDEPGSHVVISVTLDAELRRPIDSERKAIGMMLSIRDSSGTWIAELEIGWSGALIGWDAFESTEQRFATIDDLMVGIPSLVNSTAASYKQHIVNYGLDRDG